MLRGFVMNSDLVCTLLVQQDTLIIAAAGLALVIEDLPAAGEVWAGQFTLIGVVLAVVAGFMTREWQP